MGVAVAAVAAPAQHDARRRPVDIGQQSLSVLGQDLGADRHADDDRVGVGAGAIGARAVAALGRPEMLRIAEVDERVEIGRGLEDDIAAPAAVAAVRAAELDVFLAPERGHSIPAIA